MGRQMGGWVAEIAGSSLKPEEEEWLLVDAGEMNNSEIQKEAEDMEGHKGDQEKGRETSTMTQKPHVTSIQRTDGKQIHNRHRLDY